MSNRIIRLSLAIFFAAVLLNSTHAVASAADKKFEKLMDDHWANNLRENPTFATNMGVRDYDDQLSDPSLEAYDASVAKSQKFLDRLNKIKASKLSKENQLSHQLLKLDLEKSIEAANYGGKYMIMSALRGPNSAITSTFTRLPLFTKADYESYVARLSHVDDYLAKSADRLQAGLDKGWVQPCGPMQGYEKSIQGTVDQGVENSVFMQAFNNKPALIAQADFDAMREQAAKTVESEIIPAFESFRDFYVKNYAPKCREEVGTSSLPGGKEYYEFLVRSFTTTNKSADDIHKVGLSEVARIRAEMDEVIKEAKFEGTFQEWLDYLRDNPDFYPKTPAERMDAVAIISKKIDGLLPKLFGKLPRMPYGLKEIPAATAEKNTTAFYSQPAGDGSRAGFYFVNTSKLHTRPLYQLEALSLHEAVPGHHLQIALAQELDLPNFRKFGGHTVFVEGWGLYSERLGLEVGFYQTPYTNFGRLSYEMWRACRLVVDTGIHSKGWTRQQAIDYMAENSGLSMNNVVAEVDRYITWPGQALAYKTGELKIRELRAKAESELGDKFDIRAFHDRLLENGAVPLSVLESIINEWIASQKT